jgi:hypothetical protein
MTETRDIRQDWLSVPRRREDERLDPHVYERGINGLTVEEATARAFPRVMDILARSGEEYSEFERQLVKQTIRACLISQVSRANLYRIAGILVADRRDEGANRDRSLALAYVAALREAFLSELAIGEHVQTPFGAGATSPRTARTPRSGSTGDSGGRFGCRWVRSRAYPTPTRTGSAPPKRRPG